MVAGIAALGLLAGACGSDDKGSGSTVAAASPSSGDKNVQSGGTGGGKSDPIAYSKCMRANGVPNFPDPDSRGGLKIEGDKVGLGTSQYKAAEQKCKQFKAAPPPEPAVNKQAAVKYAKCMRQNGVPNFPDPNSEGGTDIDAGKIGIDINGPVYKKADETCKKVLPNGGGDGPQQQGRG